MNTRVRIFPWMVAWSAVLITRYAKGQSGRTACRDSRGHNAQAPVAELGENIMYMPSKNTSKSGPNVDAKFHNGMWLGENEERRVDHRNAEWSDQSKDFTEAPRGSKMAR